MIKKILYITLLLTSMLTLVEATATLDTNKDTYQPTEQIIVNFDNALGDDQDWIGIYPTGSSNDWENVIKWAWTGGQVSGTKSFEPLPVGSYDIRLFFQNSFNLEANKQIVVEDSNESSDTNESNSSIVTVSTTKTSYLLDEGIVANFNNMSGNNEDWIGIYPKGSSNDWGNVLAWEWIEGEIQGTKTFSPLPVGEYDVRVFFNNSFNVEANSSFVVEAPISTELNISLEKENYEPFELLHINFANMSGQASDWIGIFPIGADNEKNSSIEWRDTNSTVTGEISFNGLEAGDYELRAYFNTQLKQTVPFTIVPTEPLRVLYDDFENGTIDSRWVRVSGREMTLLNVGAIDLAVGHKERQVWVTGQHSLRTYADYYGGLNHSGYYFDFQNPDKKLKFLEVDMKIGVSSHVFGFGVKAKTKFGDRRIEFDCWLNHTLPSGQQIIRGPYGNVLEGHREAFVTANGYLHVHPAPSDFYVGTSSIDNGSNKFIHYKINIEKMLREIEPDNELLGITLFTTSGGDYDNLALSSQ